MTEKIVLWLKNEKVLIVSAVLAALTMILVPADRSYLDYINLPVLFLLFCLMAVVAGFTGCNAFQWMAAKLLKFSKNGRILGIILVLLPFFSSMLVTNDVALLTFVPFTVLLLQQTGCRQAVIPTLVFQTIAANLGSMATPFGNPQNLFLYESYHLSASSFFTTMGPLTLFSLLLLTVVSAFLLPRRLPPVKQECQIHSRKHLTLYTGLFFLCLLAVFHVIPLIFVTVLIFVSVLFFDRSLLKQLDYALLATFICFFVISGNLGRMEPVQLFLEHLLQKNTLLTSVTASQFISNVPAAVLLSNFTDQWKPLLTGVNIGGLGTPVASLASLITLKLYAATPGSRSGKYLAVFLISNFVFLALLLFLSCFIL